MIAHRRKEVYLPEQWGPKEDCDAELIDRKTGEYRLPESVIPRGDTQDPMKTAATAYGGSYDSYSVMSGGDLRVSSKDYVQLPAYARLKDGSRTPITLEMRGAEFIRSQNILNDKRVFGLEANRNIHRNVQQWKWFNRRAFDVQTAYYN